MRNRCALLALLSVLAAVAVAREEPETAAGKKKVLVELYTSQGCNSCPPASELVGKLASLGYGPDRVVTINFHVDYFNDPWKDPYSDPAFSRRQLEYNGVQKRNDLYFTPLMMVDGTYPMLGSDRPKALAAIKKALAEPPGVSLRLTSEGAGAARRFSVELAAKGPTAVDRALLVAVALVEDPIKTRVQSGENAGKTLVEHAVVRTFQHQVTRLDAAHSKTLDFPLELAEKADTSRCRVAAFVQDQASGKVYQADAMPWTPARGSR
ncbi:MAG: DUF1223 domain-containing protein [Isosphaeraceae bacterium]|nr:DUF1223 domain-containing protein [Isosphaeraceae bacterium]